MTSKQSNKTAQNVYSPLLILGAVIGVLLSAGVLSGDELGRVNLLYLLFLYFILPVVTLILTIISLVKSKHSTMFSRMLHSSFFNIQSNEYYRTLRQHKLGSLWILEQIQLFTICFSLAAVVTFFVLLLVTDISIIWRSTLLHPDDLYPVLKFIATPWSFWESAQPNLDILRATQDFRVLDTTNNALSLAAWWPFVVAVQITYAILPRLVIYSFLKVKITRANIASKEECEEQVITEPETIARNRINQLSELSSPIRAIAWDRLPDFVMQFIKQHYSQLSLVSEQSWQPEMGPLSELLDLQPRVIFVKAWEAPMGELADELENTHGYICPVNWQDDGLVAPLDVHIQEWTRFCHEVNWELITLDEQCYE